MSSLRPSLTGEKVLKQEISKLFTAKPQFFPFQEVFEGDMAAGIPPTNITHSVLSSWTFKTLRREDNNLFDPKRTYLDFFLRDVIRR
jgi:hypothetical protein